MENASQFKASWDAFDKIFDEAFSRTKKTNRPPYFSPTPFTPYPPTDYDYEPTFNPYPDNAGQNHRHTEIEEQDFDAHMHDHHEGLDKDDSYGCHDDDFYSRADMEYYDDDDYEKEFWTKRARKAQAIRNSSSGVQKVDALKPTGLGLNVGSSASSQTAIVPRPPQLSNPTQITSQPGPTVAVTGVGPGINNNNNNGVSSTSNPLANAMTAFSTAAAALNGLTNTLNNLGLGPTASSIASSVHPNPPIPSAPRIAAPVIPQVPIIAQPRPPIRKPPPPLNLDDSSSGSGSASSSSLDPTSPFKLSPGPSPPAPSAAPAAAAQFRPQFYPQRDDQFQFQQYQFQLDSPIPTSRSMFFQQQQQAPKNQGQAFTGQKQGQEPRKAQEPVPAQIRSQAQPIFVPTTSKASTQAAMQESQSQSRSLDRGMGIPLMSPSPGLKLAGALSASPGPGSVIHDNMKSPTPSTSTVHKKRRPKYPGKVSFRDSPDGTRTTATFDMQGIKKSDVHVSYQNDKVVVSWESVTVEDKIEDGKIVRERRERKFVRTLPLPEKTKFNHVKASMDGRHLHLTYPKFRS